MPEYITTDAAGKIIGREPKGRGRGRPGWVQRDDGNWYMGAKTAIPAVVRPAANKPVLVPDPPEPEDEDDGFGFDRHAAPAVTPTQGSGPDENQIGTIRKFKVTEKKTVAEFIASLHYNPTKNFVYDENRIRIRIISVMKDVIPGVPFNAVFGQIRIDLKTGTVEVLNNSPDVWHIADKHIIPDALTDLEPEKWIPAIRKWS